MDIGSFRQENFSSFIPDGYLNIDQAIDKLGSFLFKDWEENLSNQFRQELRNFEDNGFKGTFKCEVQHLTNFFEKPQVG